MAAIPKNIALIAVVVTVLATLYSIEGDGMTQGINKSWKADTELPLFDPHVADFHCQFESSHLPPVDAQADEWARQARALESAEIFVDDRDYKTIVQLTRQAAERRHWKAMLNLASLYVEKRDPAHGVDDAVKLVEEAVRLGVPAAYDQMGTYYANGTGRASDATKAYAYWQKAARMGNPDALVFLAEKMRAGVDGALPGYWANIPVSIKMLECAHAQGYGPAADLLYYIYEFPRDDRGYATGDRTTETRRRALNLLHEAVRFGCADCASTLAINFGKPFNLKDMLAPFIDPARAERYRTFSDALSFDPTDRFPNLDKVLPLPPAVLPPWNGDRDTLLNAARGVTPPPAMPAPSVTSQRKGRYFLDAAYALRATGETAAGRSAPFTGYWQPTAPTQPEQVRKELAAEPPALYSKGEEFRQFYSPIDRRVVTGVLWEYHITVPHNEEAVEPRAPKTITREVARPLPWRSARVGETCPVSGIWQPWVKASHPLRALVNQPARQAWVVKGQPFPQPRQDWQLPIDEADIAWHLMDDSGPDVIDIDVK